MVRIELRRSGERFQEADDEYGLFVGMTYEAGGGEADKIYEEVDKNVASGQKTRRYASTSHVNFCRRRANTFTEISRKKQSDRSFKLQ